MVNTFYLPLHIRTYRNRFLPCILYPMKIHFFAHPKRDTVSPDLESVRAGHVLFMPFVSSSSSQQIVRFIGLNFFWYPVDSRN